MLELLACRVSLDPRAVTERRDDTARDDSRGVEPSIRILMILDSGIDIAG
jgi:hypothetical protein